MITQSVIMLVAKIPLITQKKNKTQNNSPSYPAVLEALTDSCWCGLGYTRWCCPTLARFSAAIFTAEEDTAALCSVWLAAS